MKSMTGFAQGRFNFRDFSLFVSFKSYNNRYLEINFKGSGISAASEKIIKEMLKDKLQRGKVEIVFDLFQNSPSNWDIQLNTALLEEIMKQARAPAEKIRPGPEPAAGLPAQAAHGLPPGPRPGAPEPQGPGCHPPGARQGLRRFPGEPRPGRPLHPARPAGQHRR